jgi:predicted protein tyrosine phosphatase
MWLVQRILSRIIVLSRLAAVRFRHNADYVVISIRSPGDAIPKLRFDPHRIARINLAFHDTMPELEERSLGKLAPMSQADAKRLASFAATHWGRSDIVIHCVAGISRSAGAAAGILDALSLDAREFEGAPYDPNPHVRRLVRQELGPPFK